MEISTDDASLRVPAASSSGRRRNMQANRRRDTKPELALRSALHRAGFRYRVDYRIDLPGGRVRPDIVFTRKRIAVFVDGCFWHCCPEHGSRPSINQSYWSPKLARNVERDARNTKLLREADWTVVRIWEHESVPSALTRVTEAVMTCAAGKFGTQKSRLASAVASSSPSSD
jgi:DNA mismatch endonuclease (patch repair protein)